MSGKPQDQGGSNVLPGARPRSLEERRRLVAQSLQVGNPGNRAKDLPEQADPRHDCQIELKVEDIRPYEHNPRRASNGSFAEIKESIRASGIRNPLTVTRRPGEKHFIVEAGGNTRLLALQQLWAETHDTRFEKLTVLFRPWRSENHVLTAHLVENELRGEMTFWDKANGVLALKARLEAEKGRVLSLKLLADALRGLGLTVNTAVLAHYQFATERLRTLGEAVGDLSGVAVKMMQPRLNLMKRYTQARAGIAEDVLYATVFESVFQDAVDRYRQSKSFSPAELCRACEEALARHLDEDVAQLRSGLTSLARSPQLPLENLPSPAATNPAIDSDAIAPTPVDGSTGPKAAVSTANAATAATVGSRGAPQAEDALSLSGENPQVPSRVLEAVRLLAAVAGIDTLLRAHPASPLGYFMVSLPISAETDLSPSHQRHAWWLLAALSGQLDSATSESRVKAPTEGDSGTDDEREGSSDNLPLPVALDTGFVRWLVDPNDETANAFWDVLTLVRAARSPILANLSAASPDGL